MDLIVYTSVFSLGLIAGFCLSTYIAKKRIEIEKKRAERKKELEKALRRRALLKRALKIHKAKKKLAEQHVGSTDDTLS